MKHLLAAALLVLTTAVLGAGETANSFRVFLGSELVMDVGGKKQKINADTEIHYSWKRKAREKTLSFDLIGLRVVLDDKEVNKTTMAREKIANIVNGEKKEIAFDDAPPELQTLMRDTFGTPICTLDFDELGKETKRTILARAGAKTLLENGQIANALIFHPPYFKDKAKWDARCEISMGNGNYVSGPLTYERANKANDFAVRGILENKGAKLPGATAKEIRYDVKGTLRYDPKLEEWSSAKYTIDVIMNIVVANDQEARAKGAIAIEFELLPKKK